LEAELSQKLGQATAAHAGQIGIRLVIPAGDILFEDRPADVTEPVMRLMETMPNRYSVPARITPALVWIGANSINIC
jgi:hypothetical protein